MWHKNHIIRSVLAPCLALSALLGGGTAPAAAGEGGSATPGPDFKPGPRPGEGDGYGLGIGPGPGDGWGSGQGDGHVRATTGDPRDAGATIFTGEAFDTCLAPSAATMRAWQGASPFGAAGVYIGGRARACPNQPNLDSDWVKKVDAMGWKLIPIFVGSQSPCVRSDRKRGYLMSHNGSGDQGAEEGRTAVQDAKALGMTAHSAIYLDM
ncbi:MAG: glycoside hydrolase domain-containing protein, partial [Streptomyces sp.]